MKKAAKKGKQFSGFKPSPHKAEPIRKRPVSMPPIKEKPKPKPIPKPEPKPEPQPKPAEPLPEPKPMANAEPKRHPKIESIKETASRVKGKIRNLENKINAGRSTPPDPELAAEFDGIQADLEALEKHEE